MLQVCRCRGLPGGLPVSAADGVDDMSLDGRLQCDRRQHRSERVVGHTPAKRFVGNPCEPSAGGALSLN